MLVLLHWRDKCGLRHADKLPNNIIAFNVNRAHYYEMNTRTWLK